MTPFSQKIPDFSTRFADNESCKKFLAQLKWTDRPWCIKCNSTSMRRGSTSFHRRCTACGYEESVTKNTVFEGIRFPISKAFYLVYRIRQKQGNISGFKLMLETAMSIPSVLKFRKSVITMLAAKNIPLNEGKLDADNFLHGLY